MQLEQLSIQLENYLKEKGISQNSFAKKSGVASSYLTHILKGNFTQIPAGKDTQGNPRFTSVSTDVVKKIKRAMGIEGNAIHWPLNNYDAMYAVFLEAKANKEHRIISGKRGTGKSHTEKAFLAEYPHETFHVTCAGDMNPKQFMVRLAISVGVDSSGDRYVIRERIVEKIRTMDNPLIIIGEANNLKLPGYDSIKALYDQLELDCGIVLVGADIKNKSYYDMLKQWSDTGRGCISEMFSRFSADPAILETITYESTVAICKLYDIDKEQTRVLFAKSSDYRELDRNIKRYLSDKDLNKVA